MASKRPAGPDLTPRASLTAPSGNNHIATKPQTEKFTVHGADPELVTWMRVYSARERETIGELFNAAVRLLKAERGE
jgi:hypothetical protein